MTTQANIPNKWYVPFANGDSSRVEIPVTTADPTRASQTLGFPPLTMQPPESGGVPPQGEDFNGGMNQIARVCWWVLNGGGWPYDSTFANNANINGYPNGAKLQSADFRGDWISTADGNTNNPDTNGTNWVPGFQYGVTALSSLTGGTVTPTPAQAAKGTITLAGTLTSALTIVLPTWLKNWSITNNTTGAFVTIVKTAAGSGVTIPQNGAPTRVSGDGTNITQVAENVAAATTSTQAMQLGQFAAQATANGNIKTINVIIATSSGTYTPTAGMQFVLVEIVAGGGAGGGAPGVASQGAAGGGGAAGGFGRRLYTAAEIGASKSYTIGSAGTGVSGANGGTGGNSTFGTGATLITCNGGAGGAASVSASTVGVTGVGGVGGTTSGATDNIQGWPGSYGIGTGASGGTGGVGGSSYFGTGGATTANTSGNVATGFGAGGGGAGAQATTTTGGNATGGKVKFTEYIAA